MASLQQSGSWSTSSILVGYGLSSIIGPTNPTSAEMKRLNCRSGGKHSGKGNWMQDYRPTPIIGSGRPKKMYDYETADIVVPQQRLAGLVSRKVVKYKGLKKKTDIKITLGPNIDDDGNVEKKEKKKPDLKIDTDTVMYQSPGADPLDSPYKTASPGSSVPDPYVRPSGQYGLGSLKHTPSPRTDEEMGMMDLLNGLNS